MKTVWLFFQCRLSHAFGVLGPKSAAWHTLRSAHSYRLAQDSHTDKLIGFRYLLSAIKLVFKSDQSIPECNNAVALFKGNPEYSTEVTYLQQVDEVAPSMFMSREDFGFSAGLLNQLSMLFGLAFASPFLIYMSIFSSKRGTYASMLTDLVEIMHLAHAVKKRGVNTLWMFDSYEKDCNFMSLRLMNMGCHVIRIPSSNIISPYYHHLVCSEFIFTAPFQPEEALKFELNWHVGSARNLPPFNFPRLLEAPRRLEDQAAQTLGFISSGVWRRKERGEMSSGLGEFESEELLIETLAKFLDADRDKRLLIYLHPCEKESDALFSKAHAEYAKFFPTDRFEILDRRTPSLEAFVRSEIAVSVYSSANIERLFLGLKTLYFPACFEENVYAGTALEKVSPVTQQSLLNLIDTSLKQTNDDFFAAHELEAYRGFGLPSHLQFKSKA